MLAAVAVVGAAAPAPAASSFGLNIQSLVNWDTTWGQPSGSLPWEPYAAAMARDGMDVARTDAAWSAVQPDGPDDDLADDANWAVADRIAGTLARYGIRWLPVVDLVPEWARAAPNARPGCEQLIGRYLPPREDAMTGFAAFAGALAARYGEDGTFWAAHPELVPRPVRTYEVWNEPNVDAYWNNAPDVEGYRAMYDAARAAIRAADPAARVLVGGVVWGGSVDCRPNTANGAAWLQQLASAPGWQADGVAMHPYGASAAGVVANVRGLRRGLVAAGRPDLPLEQTELGWALRPPDAPPSSGAARSANWFDEPARAGNYAIVTDTLRGADCPGTDFLGYAAVERERHPVGENPFGIGVFDFIEHWMGVYAHGASAAGQAAPTLTSRAYADAIARDRAGANAPRDIRVCGAPEGGRLLPLDVALAQTPNPVCRQATVTYRGLPVGDAELFGSTPIGTLTGTPGRDPVFTGPDGTATFCATQAGVLRVAAQVGGGSFAPDFVPPVARSAETETFIPVPPAPAPAPVPVPPAGTAPQPVPACILTQLGLPPQRLSTVVRRRKLKTRVTLAALAPAGPCRVTLTVSIPVKSKARRKGRSKAKQRRTTIREALLGTVETTIGSTSRQTVTIRLSTAGRKRLKREKSVRATVRIGLPDALPGAQAYAKRMRLRR